MKTSESVVRPARIRKRCAIRARRKSWRAGALGAAMLLAIQPLQAEHVRKGPTKKVEVSAEQKAAIAKMHGVAQLPPQVEIALQGAAEKAKFEMLKSELRAAASLLANEKFDGPLKDSLSFARLKGLSLEGLEYADYLLLNAETPFTGGAEPFISIAIGSNKITILQDGNTREIP